MKSIKIFSIFVIFICAIALVRTEDDTAGAKKNSVLLRRNAGDAGGRRTSFSKSTTTTTPEPDFAEEEGGEPQYDENEEYDGENEEGKETSSTTTTEAPKKVIGPRIRPFRSNDDLLSALKRRQQNAKVAKSEAKARPTPVAVVRNEAREESNESGESAPAPSAPSKPSPVSIAAGGRRRFGSIAKSSNPEPPASDAQSQSLEDSSSNKAPRRPASRARFLGSK